MKEMTVGRYGVPVDDQWHAHTLSGPIVHVDCRRHDVVEFWAIIFQGAESFTRYLRVFGTGQSIPSDAVHRGTALSPYGGFSANYGSLVWHLFETEDAARYEPLSKRSTSSKDIYMS
jgi:hypothetical protein